MRLHGNESLRRRRQREQKRREILNIVCSMIVVVAIVGTFFQTMVWAQTVPQPKNETSKQQTTLDKKIDVSYFGSHIDTAPNTVVASNEDYVSPIDPEDPYAAMAEYEAEQEAEAARIKAEEEAQEAAAVAYRSSILDQYNWVQHDESGNINDMTDDLVIYTYELCNSYDIDPALVFGMIMVESRGFSDNRNGSSGAAGLGQFLSSTAKIVYEDFLGNGRGSYDHNVTPYDPYTGVTMMVTYLNYLYNRHGDTMTVLESYSGNKTYSGTLGYYNKVVSWAGKDIK